MLLNGFDGRDMLTLSARDAKKYNFGRLIDMRGPNPRPSRNTVELS